MTGMTFEQSKEFRRKIGNAVIKIQNDYREQFGPAVVVPQFIAALCSLAAYMARKNANLSRQDFLNVMEAAADEQYARDRLS